MGTEIDWIEHGLPKSTGDMGGMLWMVSSFPCKCGEAAVKLAIFYRSR
ncbi:hypothetical protein [Rhizobium sp. SYY.PMSO]